VQQRENGLRGLLLVLVAILGFSQAIGGGDIVSKPLKRVEQISTIVVSFSKLWFVPNSSISSEEIVALTELRR
jgi:hypothetical protein